MAAGQVIPSSTNDCPTLDPTNPFCFVYDNGLTYQNSSVNMADITDGTSTTVIFGESLTRPASGRRRRAAACGPTSIAPSTSRSSTTA